MRIVTIAAATLPILGHPLQAAVVFEVSKTPDIAAYVWAPLAPSES